MKLNLPITLIVICLVVFCCLLGSLLVAGLLLPAAMIIGACVAAGRVMAMMARWIQDAVAYERNLRLLRKKPRRDYDRQRELDRQIARQKGLPDVKIDRN